ncbi:MAG: patatin-like phospholipase family protein [Pseudohaliea sp.]
MQGSGDASSVTETAASDSAIVPVLSGGGGRLSAHVGVLRAIADVGIGYDTLVGVSGGGIVGALLAAGRPIDEIHDLARQTDFSQFATQNVVSLLRTGGLSSGDAFQRWMDRELGGRTFNDLERDLRVVATDVRSGGPVVFDREQHGEMPVAEAVRYSMSVPILFSFKEFEQKLLVDGSILSEDALIRDWTGRGTPVVVFRLRSTHTTAEPAHAFPPARAYLELLVRAFLTTLSREYVNDDFWLSTIVIDAGTTSPMDLSLPPERKEELYRVAYETTREILPRKLAQRFGKAGAAS